MHAQHYAMALDLFRYHRRAMYEQFNLTGNIDLIDRLHDRIKYPVDNVEEVGDHCRVQFNIGPNEPRLTIDMTWREYHDLPAVWVSGPAPVLA